ncbi:MAG: hypothetical protein ACYTG2_18780 [Planctomycetota bacterium]|jgi:hypothetical protein
MSKRLITDRDVQTGAVRPPIVLDEHTLITPSARDRAMRLGWTLVEPLAPGAAGGASTPAGGTCDGDCARCGRSGCAGGCASACGAATTGTAAARLDELADGLYLVRIEGGRRVSVLPASGPGVLLRATAPGSRG